MLSRRLSPMRLASFEALLRRAPQDEERCTEFLILRCEPQASLEGRMRWSVALGAGEAGAGGAAERVVRAGQRRGPGRAVARGRVDVLLRAVGAGGLVGGGRALA